MQFLSEYARVGAQALLHPHSCIKLYPWLTFKKKYGLEFIAAGISKSWKRMQAKSKAWVLSCITLYSDETLLGKNVIEWINLTLNTDLTSNPLALVNPSILQIHQNRKVLLTDEKIYSMKARHYNNLLCFTLQHHTPIGSLFWKSSPVIWKPDSMWAVRPAQRLRDLPRLSSRDLGLILLDLFTAKSGLNYSQEVGEQNSKMFTVQRFLR